MIVRSSLRLGRLEREKALAAASPSKTCRAHVTVPTVPSSATMRVPVMAVARREHADQIDGESERAYDEKLPRIHLWRVEEALNSLEDDEDGDET